MTSLRHKLWLGFGGLLLILLAVSILSLVVLTRYSHALDRIFRENYDSAVYCDTMKESLDELNLRAQRMIWEESTARQIDYATPQANFEKSLQSQLGNCTLPGELESTQRLASLWTQYKSHYEQFDKLAAGRAELYRQQLLPQYQDLMQVAQNIADRNMSNMVSVDGQAKRTLVDVRNALLILVTAGTLLAALVVWAAGAAILKPLKTLTKSARQIEAGNLNLNIQTRSRDEIGQLAEAFNAMTLRLREFRQIDHDNLARSRQTTQLAIDSLPDAVLVIGPSGIVEISNRTAKTYFGIEPGRTIAQLNLKWLSSLYEQVSIRGQAVEPREYRSAIQLFDNGQEKFLLPRAVPMLDSDKRQIGVTVILVDVTALRHVDEVKSSVVATVSHELRTPLTSMRMALGMLTSAPSPNQSRLIAVAKEESDRLYRIIENLLSISRIESGRAQFQFQPMSPRDVILSAVDPLRPSFAGKNLNLEIAAPADLPLVKVDAVAIGSALTNLLSNAIKYTPAGGSVRVAAEQDGGFIYLIVADTGPGIAEEYRTRIFEKFFRISSTSEVPGAGLGLSIAREIVEAHNGRIEYSPQPTATGAVFRITLLAVPQ